MIFTPQLPIRVDRPSEIVTEHEKFQNSGQWFLEMGRWIALNLYNTYSSANSFNQPNAINGIRNSAGNAISTVGNTTSIVDEMLDNLTYFTGAQNNRIFDFLTKGVNNNTLPNVMLQGQEIRSLSDHIRGKCLQMIQPIEKNISCETISQHTLVKRQEVFDKIDLAAMIGDVLTELGGGVKYNPAGDIDYSNPSQIKDAKKKVRDQYENTATVIGRNAYYKCNLAEKFLSAATDQVIFNLCGIEFKEEHGEMIANYIPGYQAIYDYSTWGEYGDGQTKGGYIVPMTVEEALQEYPDMNPDWKKEMGEVLSGAEGANQFIEYWNQPFTNVRWWYNDQRWISKAVVYWISECDTRYIEKENRGLKKVTKIDDYKNYHDPELWGTSQIPTGTKLKKGYEISGSSKVWKVHKAVILGNKYLVEYGYDTYQVRPFGDKRKPEIPIKFFCQGKIAGYVRSIVSRLKHKQDELDAVRYRIREHIATDLYGIFIDGRKLTENLSALNVVNDLRTAHVSVLTSTGDEIADARGINDLVKMVDNQSVKAIADYMVIKQDLEREMSDILNIPPAALGDQSAYMGKGAVQNSVSRSEISSLPFYSSLMEYYRRTLQYAVNKNKMILLDNKDKEVVLPISNKDIEVLELTKEFNYQDLNCYLSPNDSMQAEDMALFRQTLQAYSQNPSTDHAKAILNALKLMRSKSFQEGIYMFEEFIKEQEVEDQKKQLQEVQVEMQQQHLQQISAQQNLIQQNVAKIMGDLAKVNLQGAWNLKLEETKQGLDLEKELSSKIIEEVTKQLAAVSQQQQSPAPQPMEAQA